MRGRHGRFGRLDEQRLSTLLNGEYDGKNAILTFHAGAGGTKRRLGRNAVQDGAYWAGGTALNIRFPITSTGTRRD